MIVKGSDSKYVYIQDELKKLIQVEKKFVFKFDSTRKLMSCVIEYEGDLLLFVKGADSSVASRALNGKEEQLPQSFSEEVDMFLDMGLRVMFMGVRILSQDEFSTFMNELKTLEGSPNSTSE